VKTDGIEAVYLTTHNWGKTAKFFRSLGFELEFETDHNSGQLRSGVGPAVFIAEVPSNQDTAIEIVLRIPDTDGSRPDGVDVVTPFQETHWGTRDMTVRDPDGRIWRLQAPGKGAASAHHA
jgi:hypothetical protein